MADVFNEVDEELRRDGFSKLWRKYGIIVIAVAVLIVVGTGGYKVWESWSISNAQSAGDKFMAAIAAGDEGRADEAQELLAAIKTDAHGEYPALARFRSASQYAVSGDIDKAIAEYQTISADTSLKQVMRDLASLRTAMLQLDNGSLDAVLDTLRGVSDAGRPFMHSAREVIAVAHWKAGDGSQSQKAFEQLSSDATAPQLIRQRASLMLELLESEIGKPATSGTSQ